MDFQQQVIEKSAHEQVRIDRKGENAEVRIWTRHAVAAAWRPSNRFINVPMKRLLSLTDECEAAIKSSVGIEKRSKKELSPGNNVVPLSLFRDSTAMSRRLTELQKQMQREHQIFREKLINATMTLMKEGGTV